MRSDAIGAVPDKTTLLSNLQQFSDDFLDLFVAAGPDGQVILRALAGQQ